MQNCVLSTKLALNNILDFNFRTVKFMVIKLLVVERFFALFCYMCVTTK